LVSQKNRAAARMQATTIPATAPCNEQRVEKQVRSVTRGRRLTASNAADVRHGIHAGEEARRVIAQANAAEVNETGDVDQNA
jgi:hypothetical protein